MCHLFTLIIGTNIVNKINWKVFRGGTSSEECICLFAEKEYSWKELYRVFKESPTHSRQLNEVNKMKKIGIDKSRQLAKKVIRKWGKNNG